MVIIKMPERIKPRFSRYIGIDYSGAETPDSSLKGLRVYEADRESDAGRGGTAAQPAQVLDPARPGGMAGGAVVRGCADHRWYRPRFFLSPAVFRGSSAGAGLADLSRRFPEALADRRRSHLRRFHSPRFAGRRRGPFRQRPLATDHRGAGRGQVGLSFRRARFGGQIDPCRTALAALSAQSAWGAGPLLALRRLGDPCGQIRAGGGLSVAVEQELLHGRAARPTSTMPTSLPPGCGRWTRMAASVNFSSPTCCPANTLLPRSKDGFSA